MDLLRDDILNRESNIEELGTFDLLLASVVVPFFYDLYPTFLCHIFNYLMLLLHAQPCMHAFDDFELLFWQSPQAHANSWQQ